MALNHRPSRAGARRECLAHAGPRWAWSTRPAPGMSTFLPVVSACAGEGPTGTAGPAARGGEPRHWHGHAGVHPNCRRAVLCDRAPARSAGVSRARFR